MRCRRRPVVIKCIKRNKNRVFRVCGGDQTSESVELRCPSQVFRHMPRATECENKRCFVNILVWFPESKNIGTTPQHLVRRAGENCHKENLRLAAVKLGETVAENVTSVESTEIIKESKYFEEDIEFVKEFIQVTIEDRKNTEEDRNKAEEERKKAEEERKKQLLFS
ncbi:hypothetical protein TNCV_2733961 [Trichonephila clavipes]|nr:hypothetical protein TNCV_2733961 [Trichonephila clavipes]